MEKHSVIGRYDVWAGVWQVEQSSLPGVEIEASTSDEFTKAAYQVCRECSIQPNHRIEVLYKKPALWSVSFPFLKRVLLNGRLVPRHQAEVVKARYAAAG
jgi:hypothetical protein